MRRVRLMMIATCLPCLPLESAQAQSYQDSTGFYGQVALVVGWPNIDSVGGPVAPIETGTMVGLSFTGGYRIATWIGVDAEFMWVGGADVVDATFGPQFGVKLADACFGAGLELLLTDHWGTCVDGGYYVAGDELFEGTGTLRFGAQYNF
jgi:hypothetical protein